MFSQIEETIKKHKLQILQIEINRQKVMFDAICFSHHSSKKPLQKMNNVETLTKINLFFTHQR